MKTVLSIEEGSSPLAVVYYGEKLGVELARQLRAQGLQVRHMAKETESLPVWEKPDYLFSFGEAIPADETRALRIKIKGRIKDDPFWLEQTAQKIIKESFSSGKEEIEVLGARSADFVGKRWDRAAEQVTMTLSWKKKRKFEKKSLVVALVLTTVFLVTLPFFWLGFSTILGFSQVLGATRALERNDTSRAQMLARSAREHFVQAKATVKFTGIFSPIFTQRYFNFLDVGEKTADVIERGSRLLPQAQNLLQQMTNGSGEAPVAAIRLELPPMDQDLGFIEGQLGQFMTTRMVNFLTFFGVSRAQALAYKREISQARRVIKEVDSLLSVWEEIVPKDQKRTYLIVFQNSAELRPTGGFIGAYALVNFDSGRMTVKIYDVYTADGQLTGHVAPPDEILHFLGQPSWYLRDANFSPDWVLTAKRLEWFLEKEIGVKADGVIGVNLGAIQKLLAVAGEVTLPDGQRVSAKNFFEKAEFAAEINFFPGSTQKGQFLASVATALLAKLEFGQSLNWLTVAAAGQQALTEKDLLFYFNSPAVSKVVAETGWDGVIPASGNFLGLVEANFGANKANYFVKRSLRVDSVIDKAGGLETTVVVSYRNDSPNASWPGGNYKSYLRLLVPEGSKLEKIDLGDKKEATVSSVLTQDVLKAVLPGQFLVLRSLENGVATSFGVLVEVPVQKERAVKFVYRPTYQMDFKKKETPFLLKFWKQPGTGADSLDFALDYPSFLQPIGEDPSDRDVSVLALPQKLVYNTDLSRDRTIYVGFNINRPN